ncbi:MAG TPA: SgcJ/EcaC family oxidoreductase [Pyrinomonadaceae bacterium]|nr:SgcJ/EcaC family oxidoreductase [Pyrinomonadaceae bacterium]
MRLLILVLILILTGLNAAAQRQQSPARSASSSQSVVRTPKKQTARSPLETKLSRVCGEWAEYWRQKKLDDVVALYAPDAVFLTGTGDRFTGRNAIRAVFKTAMEGHTSDLTPRSLVTEISGNLAYDSGDYLETIIPASGVAKTELKGNYVIVFKRQRSGKWLIIEHVWTVKPAQ